LPRDQTPAGADRGNSKMSSGQNDRKDYNVYDTISQLATFKPSINT